jgi:hypothetical protein
LAGMLWLHSSKADVCFAGSAVTAAAPKRHARGSRGARGSAKAPLYYRVQAG